MLFPIFVIFVISTAMVGLTYMWFTQISDDVDNSGIKKIQIKSAFVNSVLLLNTGEATIRTNEIVFYVDRGRTSCRFSFDKVEPGGNLTCLLDTPCGVGSTLVVATQDWQHQYYC